MTPKISESPILINVHTSDPKQFRFVLQKGFGVSIRPGCSLKELLADQFNISDHYTDSRIQTVFLNYKPVDDYASAMIHDNDILALSTAMPGLVGATFRRGGALSPFRSQVSFRSQGNPESSPQQGRLTLKLFNHLADELGQPFLEKGIWITSDTLVQLHDQAGERQGTGFQLISINNKKPETQQVKQLMTADPPVDLFMTVR